MTPNSDTNTLGSLGRTFAGLTLETPTHETIDFEEFHNMSLLDRPEGEESPFATAPTMTIKEIKMAPPKKFSGKRTDYRRFMQEVIVWVTVNKDMFRDDDAKIAFTLSFMQDGEAGAWKEQYVAEALKSADDRGDDFSLGSWKTFRKELDEAFLPYDAPGDALDEMRRMRAGSDVAMDEHIAKFKILVAQSTLPDSGALVDFFRETLPTALQKQIMCCENPPETLHGWYEKASRFHNNWRKMQRILNRGKTTTTTTTATTTGQTPQKKYYFPRKERERDPMAMEVDKLTIEERAECMRTGKCFRCRKPGLARDCPNHQQQQQTQKKNWSGKEAATHIRSMIAGMTKEEREKLQANAETEGLGF